MAKEEPGLSGLCQTGKATNPDSVRGDNTTMDDRVKIKTSGFLNGIDHRNRTTTTFGQVDKINFSVGTRHLNVRVPTGYEIPKEVLLEETMNAVAHRDYTSHASVQVMLLADHPKVRNPGRLSQQQAIPDLSKLYCSYSPNELIAELRRERAAIEDAQCLAKVDEAKNGRFDAACEIEVLKSIEQEIMK